MPVKGESQYSEQEITDCLMAVIAWAGNCSAAERHLKSEGKHCPAVGTLTTWIRGPHAVKYDMLREKFREQLETNLANEYRDVARIAVDVQRKALDRAMEALEAGNDKTPSRTAADAATVADKMTGKLLSLTGRPTSIREERNLEETLRSLVARGYLKLPGEQSQLESG